MKTLIIKTNKLDFKFDYIHLNPISKSIKNIAKKWISNFSPDIPMKTLYNRYLKKKLVRWGPNPKPPGGNLCLLGLNPLFHHPVLLLILNYHDHN